MNHPQWYACRYYKPISPVEDSECAHFDPTGLIHYKSCVIDTQMDCFFCGDELKARVERARQGDNND